MFNVCGFKRDGKAGMTDVTGGCGDGGPRALSRFFRLLAGFAVKTPLIPLHTWLPVVAQATGSHSGVAWQVWNWEPMVCSQTSRCLWHHRRHWKVSPAAGWAGVNSDCSCGGGVGPFRQTELCDA